MERPAVGCLWRERLKAVSGYTKSTEFRNLLKFLYKVGYKSDHRGRKIGKATFWVVL
jgi:hypothetical protein